MTHAQWNWVIGWAKSIDRYLQSGMFDIIIGDYKLNKIEFVYNKVGMLESIIFKSNGPKQIMPFDLIVEATDYDLVQKNFINDIRIYNKQMSFKPYYE